MSNASTYNFSFRTEASVGSAIADLAKKEGIDRNAYAQRVLTNHAISKGDMDADECTRLQHSHKILDWAVAKARELDGAGLFNEHLILDVIKAAMIDPDIRAKYEKVVGGDAYMRLPGKKPINLNLGSYIKNAVDAKPKLDTSGKPERINVINQPIQSYTLLRK